MNMHKSLVAVLGLILISSTASAATCRAGSAAQAGSNTGYEASTCSCGMHGHNVKTMSPHPCSPVCHESKKSA